MADKIIDFGGTFVLSLIGILLLILRRRRLGNPNTLDSAGLLILIMVPITSSIAFFLEPGVFLSWWLAFYFAGIFLWYLVGITVMNRAEDNRTRRQSDFQHTLWLGGLICIGIMAYWLFLNLSSPISPPQG